MPCGGRITRRWADRDTAWNTVVVEPVGSCWQGKRHGEEDANSDVGMHRVRLDDDQMGWTMRRVSNLGFGS